MKNILQLFILSMGLFVISSCGGDENLEKNLTDIYGNWEATSVMIDGSEQLPNPIEEFNFAIVNVENIDWIDVNWIELPSGDAWGLGSSFSIEDDVITLSIPAEKWGDLLTVESLSEDKMVVTGINPSGQNFRIETTKF